MNSESASGEFSELAGHEYINLYTFRVDGSAVQATVMFVVRGDYIYMQTPRSAGKVKRIMATGRVLVQPSIATGAPLGKTILGIGRVVGDGEASQATQALRDKYGSRHTDFLAQIAQGEQECETIEIRAWDE